MENLVSKFLTENNLLLDADKKHAENSIKIYNEREIVISGNKLGLIELADYIVNVAMMDIEGYHIHLDESNFFDKTNLELIILKQKENS